MNEPWWRSVILEQFNPDVDDGIWHLHPQQGDRFFAEYLSDAFLSNLLLNAQSKGWRAAVEDSLSLLRPDLAAYTRDYLLEPYRAAFVDGMSIKEGSKVLDLGCGWGFASQRCLEKGAFVVGTEGALGRLQFCAVRFAQQGFADHFIGIEMDANHPFPFYPESFNAVIVSGLMEWLPSTAVGEAESIQRRFLERCAAVLRPGGQLYLAIENRWWWRYFLGARDLHRVHRLQVLTSVLPRRLARAWSILVTGSDYRTYTYSFFEYLKLLQSVGFTMVNASYPEPDYVQPRHVRSLCHQIPLHSAGRELQQAVRAQHPPRFLISFGRSFTFVATK